MEMLQKGSRIPEDKVIITFNVTVFEEMLFTMQM
jgi:hypothetical protein